MICGLPIIVSLSFDYLRYLFSQALQLLMIINTSINTVSYIHRVSRSCTSTWLCSPPIWSRRTRRWRHWNSTSNMGPRQIHRYDTGPLEPNRWGWGAFWVRRIHCRGPGRLNSHTGPSALHYVIQGPGAPYQWWMYRYWTHALQRLLTQDSGERINTLNDIISSEHFSVRFGTMSAILCSPIRQKNVAKLILSIDMKNYALSLGYALCWNVSTVPID